jgi:hypothetical protein
MHSFVPARRLVPALLTSVVALGAVAGTASAAGTQTFDVTTRLQCDGVFYGPLIPVVAPPNDAFNVRIQGTAPATTAPGEPVQLTDVSATAQLADNHSRFLPADYDRLLAYPRNLSLAVTGSTPGSIALLPLTGAAGSTNTATGWEPFSLGSFSPGAVQTTGADPVVIKAGKFDLNFKIVDHSPYQLADLGPQFSCSAAADAPPLVTIANTGAPVVVGPVVKSVSGSAVAKVGGLVQIRGKNLAGAKSVTVGTRRVSPLLSSAGSVWIWAPPLAKGAYLVTVTTAAGTSEPVQTVRVTYR